MNIKKRNFISLLLVMFLLGGSTTWGLAKITDKGLGSGYVKIAKEDYKRYKQMNDRYGKLDLLYEKINGGFYKEPNQDRLKIGTYKGLIAGLGDPYSTYMTKEEYDSWMAGTMGEFDGIGITFSVNQEGEIVIISVIPNTPAKKIGLKSGDIILAVDGKVYTDGEAAGAAMRGKAGTKVKVSYYRDGKEKTVTITRAKIINESVTGKMEKGNIAYIKISGFEEHTAEDFEAKLNQLIKKGAKGLIIDLRENGGGLVDSGVSIADMLLGKGIVTYLEDRDGNKKTYRSDASKTDLPYVLLVDEGTASTSEILAAAVKDDGKNKIVGTKTFGKGVVQSTETLKDGSALKLTIMQYFSPKGNQINGKGVRPDYIVKNGKDGVDKQLKKALSLLQ